MTMLGIFLSGVASGLLVAAIASRLDLVARRMMSDPLTGKASEATRDRVARAIFFLRSPAPEWPMLLSEYVRNLSRAQADAAIAELAAID